ncbi:hypothetical protein DAPPUDRAFT_264338 [Daphnia pulex]|uniref:Kinetochore protein Nuf2 N-terminal domain-containing protein n=1 Tax=Daphnia pulex TaxID=6669 RepID=E9HRD7_DAPPU|nr:hypothetical protein DAPPUDRAFT_264338 [Daphnia pulex]|eukprot:EFX65706.1 hypothetical protein DAPPUDRAFT_264338 [Daphnia pulex]
MNSERQDEDVVRIMNLSEFSRNPEMLIHLEGPFALYREINRILKRLGYNNFKYIDILKPTSNMMREVLLGLVNFLAYFEAEENNKEDIEAEIQCLKNKTLQYEKLLVEEERYLDKCKQSEEEKKIMAAELRKLVVHRKEKYLKIEAIVKKEEVEVDEITKRIRSTHAKLEQETNTLKQIEIEKERAEEEVVLDPEGLEAEFEKSKADKENIESDFTCLKSRLPVLEQQIQDRTMQLQEHQETHQRIVQVKARESKIKQEWQKADADNRRVEEENHILENQFKKDKSIIESKKRMLDEMEQKMEKLSGLLEKTRLEMKKCMSEDESRKTQQQEKVLAMENAVLQLKQDLKLGQKVLEEGAVTFEDIHRKHQQNVEEINLKYLQRFEDLENLVRGIFPKF